ncbi:MAG: hypothetical protein IJ677_06380 [Alphaproteobacteria bacterium]|nr:hypothetical protein [Alphaproteobacteria bacterium]
MAEDEKKQETETVLKDFDFETFLAEIGKENPDMSVIKSGIEKFGTGKLSDAQKEQFLKTIFPNSDNNHLTAKTQKLGFENISGIKNTLIALKDLQNQGILNDEQVNNVMSVKYPPENGKNMAMTLALNIRAAEFKWKKATNPENIAIAKHNLQTYSETLAIMEQIEPKALKNALTEPYEPDNINRVLTINDLAAKSEILAEFMQKPSVYKAISAENNLTVDGENKTIVGGENNGLTVDGAQKPALKVNTKSPQPEEDADNVANMNPNSGDDKKKRKPFEFEKVKEQDIIQYMFEHWFLEGVTLALKAPFWLIDKSIDAFDGKFDTNMPTPTKPGQLAKNVPAIKFLNDTGEKLAQDVTDNLNTQVDYYDRLYNTIKQNAGKPINKWYIDTVDRYSQVPILDIKNPLDVKKMQEFNKIFEQNPEAFVKKFDVTQTQLRDELKNFALLARVAGSLATATYMADHPEGPFGPNAEATIQKNMTEYMQKIAEISQVLTDRAEDEYRLKNGLAPDAKLDEKQAREILAIRDKNFEKFVDDLGDNTKTFRSNLNSYYNAESASEQAIKLQQVKASRESVEKILSPEYLDSLAPRKEGVKGKPVEKPLLDFTKDFNAAEAQDAAFTAALEGNRKIYEGLHTEQEKKKTALNERPFVKKAKGKIKQLHGSVVGLFKGNGKQK